MQIIRIVCLRMKIAACSWTLELHHALIHQNSNRVLLGTTIYRVNQIGVEPLTRGIYSWNWTIFMLRLCGNRKCFVLLFILIGQFFKLVKFCMTIKIFFEDWLCGYFWESCSVWREAPINEPFTYFVNTLKLYICIWSYHFVYNSRYNLIVFVSLTHKSGAQNYCDSDLTIR